MRKLLTILLAAVLCLSLAACGGSGPDKQPAIDAYNAAVQPLLQVYAGHNNGWFILPLIAGGTQFLANWIMQKGQPAPDPNNPAASTNKMMMWLFPLMSLWFCLSYNAAFAIYSPAYSWCW